MYKTIIVYNERINIWIKLDTIKMQGQMPEQTEVSLSDSF